jgi:hypothetical protein
MTWKQATALIGSLLVIVCGEAVKLGYTEWGQLTALVYWLGIGIQVGGLLGAYQVGRYQAPPNRRLVDEP